MKIALVILHADPARGGAERYTVDLAAALGRRGHEVTLISSESLGINAITRTGQYEAFLQSLDEHLSQNRYDIVHAMLPVRRCDLYHPHAGLAVEAARKANVLFNPRRRAMAKVERKLLRSTPPPVVLCLSEYSKSQVLKHYTLPPDRLTTLFNAVDLARFIPGEPRAAWINQASSSDVVGLIIANDFERKGLATAIRAAAKTKSPELALTVLGKEDAKPYQRMTERCGARVTFAGAVSDPRPYYDAADFFVLPTKHDPCSLVVLEALAMGVPVISTKFNGACEVMTSGLHGYVLDDPNDIAALAQAMRWMLDCYHREEFGKACVALRPTLSYEQHLDRLLDIYGQVVRSR